VILTQFLSEIRDVRWFASVGEPLSPDLGLTQLASWNDWPGPECPEVIELFLRDADLKAALLASDSSRIEELQHAFDVAHDTVLSAAANHVDFGPDKDAWHAPSTAVWQAAWVAGLVAMHLVLGRELPRDLAREWELFRAGHWPAGYADPVSEGKHRRILVY
jgi:hypothetical protein